MSEGNGRRTVRVRIEGRVQGVGFRHFTYCAAVELGITGFVRNRHDGAVEALFCGAPDAVAAILERCRRGPAGARVARVEIIGEGDDAPAGFVVLSTNGDG